MTNSYPQSNSLIMVEIFPSLRDLEVASVLEWYRIPLRTGPKIVAVDYLEFYQPASFGDRKWKIEKISPVRGYELVTRAEIIRNEPDHPKAGEEYFIMQLGPLLDLSKPIRAEKWKRITFFYTTWQYLLTAKTINDLVVHSGERKLLWQSLRERTEHEHEYKVPDVDLSPDILVALLGIKEFGGNYEN